MKLTEHFTLEELSTTNKKEFKAENIKYAEKFLDGKIQHLANFAEKVREILNLNSKIEIFIDITQGVRCPKLNLAIKGSTTSQHPKCEAIDFIPINMTVKKAFDLLRKSNLEFGQLILEIRGDVAWIHISIGFKKEVLISYDGGKTYQEVI